MSRITKVLLVTALGAVLAVGVAYHSTPVRADARKAETGKGKGKGKGGCQGSSCAPVRLTGLPKLDRELVNQGLNTNSGSSVVRALRGAGASAFNVLFHPIVQRPINYSEQELEITRRKALLETDPLKITEVIAADARRAANERAPHNGCRYACEYVRETVAGLKHPCYSNIDVDTLMTHSWTHVVNTLTFENNESAVKVAIDPLNHGANPGWDFLGIVED